MIKERKLINFAFFWFQFNFVFFIPCFHTSADSNIQSNQASPPNHECCAPAAVGPGESINCSRSAQPLHHDFLAAHHLVAMPSIIPEHGWRHCIRRSSETCHRRNCCLPTCVLFPLPKICQRLSRGFVFKSHCGESIIKK